MISSIIFILLLGTTVFLFAKKIGKIKRNILLGKDIDLTDNPAQRWKTMALVALGQSKMVTRPLAGIMHILIYVGFVIINIEILEIILDGIFGTHRLFAPILGEGFYNFLINSFEVLAVGVLVSCVVFLIRRNAGAVRRFQAREMAKWPSLDGNLILVIEILLMFAFLFMNAADSLIMLRPDGYLIEMAFEKYVIDGYDGGFFLVSQWLTGFLPDALAPTVVIERVCWWFHIIGILAFLNYVPYSKHFHIFLAFPNTYYSNLNPKGQFENLATVKAEVDLMMSGDPFAAPAEPTEAPAEPQRFGAKDVQDLNWKQLMEAYSCTECGRCTSVCPANQTGKLLSPRKIMMDTRDRLDIVGKNIDANSEFKDDGQSLLHNHIKPEELWACTTCNACVDACPINIDPLSIIVDLRQFLVMEESAAPTELNGMFSNTENNGAPWQFAQSDRLNWAQES